MAQISVFDSATTSTGASPTMYDRPGSVGDLRQAISERTGLLLNDFFLNFAGRKLEDSELIPSEDEPGYPFPAYVTIMHVGAGAGNSAGAGNGAGAGNSAGAASGLATTGGRRRRGSRKTRRAHRKSRRNNAMAGGRRRRGSRKSRRAHRRRHH